MNRIKEYRLKIGLTQKELAERLGCEPSAVSNYERDYRSPDIPTIKGFIKIFGEHGISTSLNDLFPEESAA